MALDVYDVLRTAVGELDDEQREEFYALLPEERLQRVSGYLAAAISHGEEFRDGEVNYIVIEGGLKKLISRNPPDFAARVLGYGAMDNFFREGFGAATVFSYVREQIRPEYDKVAAPDPADDGDTKPTFTFESLLSTGRSGSYAHGKFNEMLGKRKVKQEREARERVVTSRFLAAAVGIVAFGAGYVLNHMLSPSNVTISPQAPVPVSARADESTFAGALAAGQEHKELAEDYKGRYVGLHQEYLELDAVSTPGVLLMAAEGDEVATFLDCLTVERGTQDASTGDWRLRTANNESLVNLVMVGAGRSFDKAAAVRKIELATATGAWKISAGEYSSLQGSATCYDLRDDLVARVLEEKEE